MSSSSGAPSPRAASASRNIVLQKGQAAATTPAPVADQLRRAHLAHALACLLAQKRQPSAGAAAKTPLMRARCFNQLAGQRRNLPRLVVYPTIAPQIARIVEDNLLLVFWTEGSLRCEARQKLAVMFHLGRRAKLLPVLLNGAHAMRADGDDLLHVDSAPAPPGSPRPVAERADRCPAAAPDRPCTSPCAARRSLRPGAASRAPGPATISRPLGSYPPMQPSHRQYSCVPSKMGSAFFSTNLSRSAALRPNALLPCLQSQKQLGSMVVLPCARVHRAAPQADEDRHMLNAHRALKLARPAGGALENRLLRVVFAQQRLLDRGPNSFR